MQVNMLEAKNQLSKLVKAALDGVDVIIAKHGQPMARLVKLVDQPTTRGHGAWKGVVELADDWDSPETNSAIARATRVRQFAPPNRPYFQQKQGLSIRL